MKTFEKICVRIFPVKLLDARSGDEITDKTDEEISMRNDEGNGIAYGKAYILSFLRLIKAGRWKAWCPDIIMPTAAMS